MKDREYELVVSKEECYISGPDGFYEIKGLSDFKLNPIDLSRVLYSEDSALVIERETFLAIEPVLRDHFTNK